jgi:hypothetical protein
MSATFPIPKKLMQQLLEEHGRNPQEWNQELQDLINPTIEARDIAPPLSGRIEKILNTDYHYHWAFDRCGSTPDHDRVESLRYAGWEFASTDDVRMCAESTVIGRKQGRPSKDGKGFSEEIRSGDRRLMKLAMGKWRSLRKAQNIAAYQMAYPQPFDAKGKAMTAENLIPGMPTRMLEPKEITEAHEQALRQNPQVQQ